MKSILINLRIQHTFPFHEKKLNKILAWTLDNVPIIIANRCNGYDRKGTDHFFVPTGKQVASWSQFKIVSSFIVASKRNV